MRESLSKLADKALEKSTWQLSRKASLPLFFSPLLASESNLVHAFSCRQGGQSEPPYESFNLGRHMDLPEAKEDASENREYLCRILSLDFDKLTVPSQVHSKKIAWVTDKQSPQEFDGVATVTPGLPILLHFADCVPIILYDRKLKALAVLHAGWKGTASGIAKEAVSKFQDMLGSRADNIIAAVGPAIGSCCYPVGDDIAEQLSQSVTNCEGLIDFIDGKPHPDLKAFNAMQMLECGVGAVDVTSHCTCCSPELFYSHRGFNGQTGRQGAIAGLKE